MEDVDQFIYDVLTSAARQQRSLGILFVESFLTCGDRTARCDAVCPGHAKDVWNTTSQASDLLLRP